MLTVNQKATMICAALESVAMMIFFTWIIKHAIDDLKELKKHGLWGWYVCSIAAVPVAFSMICVSVFVLYVVYLSYR